MPFSINDFQSKGVQFGFTRPSFFIVTISGNGSAWMNKHADKLEQLTYLCSGAAVPGSTILTTEEKLAGQGLTVKVPYDVGFTDVNLRFYSDGQGHALSFFHGWLRNIVGVSGQGKASTAALAGFVNYPKQYKTTIDIYQYNDHVVEGSRESWVAKYSLINAFPVSVGEIELDWGSTDEVSSVNVNFTFERFEYGKKAVQLGGAQGERTIPAAVDVQSNPAGVAPPYYSRANQLEEAGYQNALLNTMGLLGSSKLTMALQGLQQAQSVRDAVNQFKTLDVKTITSSIKSSAMSQLPSIPGGFKFP